MIEQLLTKEIISPIFIVIIAILFYILIKKIIIKTFRGSSKFRAHKKSLTIMNLFINIMKYMTSDIYIGKYLLILNKYPEINAVIIVVIPYITFALFLTV